MVKKMRRHITALIFLLGLSSTNAPAQEKIALSLFHFNLQYVAGDYRIEKRIIRESLRPVLELFDAHPNWKITLEIQGYALEVLQEEHPDVLALLRKLVGRGQVELVIAHYSDQLYIAYPALDLQRSIEISDEILENLKLRRSRVFAGQEIQWSPALAQALQGKYDILLTSADPFGYYGRRTLPLVRVRYAGNEMLALIGGGKKNLPGLQWTWAFFDDGEVFHTLDYNSDFYRVPEEEKKNLARYEKLAAEGYHFVTVTEFANILKNRKDYRILEAPFVPEGTWNMDVGGPFLWMGKQRSGVETDGVTRALCYRVRGLVLLAERLVEYAAAMGRDVHELKKWLKKAWRHLLLSEVSDSSGWTPLLIEVRYTDNEANVAETIVNNVMQILRKLIPPEAFPLQVDTRSGRVDHYRPDTTANEVPVHPPVPLFLRAEKATHSCKQIRPGLYRIDITCLRPADGAVEIAFATADTGLYYSPTCGEDSFVPIPTDLKNDPILALANGFIALGNGFNLIKDCSVSHLAATWKRDARRLVFREELNTAAPEMRMRFYILEGTPEQGLALANRLNPWPVFVVRMQDDMIVPEKLIFGLHKSESTND